MFFSQRQIFLVDVITDFVMSDRKVKNGNEGLMDFYDLSKVIVDIRVLSSLKTCNYLVINTNKSL